ncbi:hypothetical protein GCM10011409_14810 [Lentibacillus populi]|uniref:Uncharacterized protein n=2 Tax=Bacillaceae TaxID=186817 RepID=A0A9W5X5D8_9BACI|nr:hypothetical protein [Lentibacillus populi]GGB38348.1 hypothetical protein GCM10011409_14810 [Lentibacillus populi]
MNANGFVYAAGMSNQLALDIPEDKWDVKLIDELGTLRKLFRHLVRIRGVYTDGIQNGVIHFPGNIKLMNQI